MARAEPGGPSLQVTGGPTIDLSENRRLVTVLFGDLSGSTALGERLDPEDLRRILGQFFSAMAREIQRYGGTVDKFVGDAVMAVFGAPVAHEDDAERAINAAIAMQAAIAGLNDDLDRRFAARLGLRIGINTGEVVAGLMAGEVQAAYTVVGDTVNTAQRFEAAAEPGSILVGLATRELTHRIFDYEEHTPLLLKGKLEAQRAFRLVGARFDVADLPVAPLVGRELELDHLRDALAEAARGSGSLVHLVGDAGIGKSRLIRELRARPTFDTLRHIVGRCVSFETEQPFALLARLLRQALGVPAGQPESVARTVVEGTLATISRSFDPLDASLVLEVLGYAEASGVDPHSRQRMLVQLLRRLLHGLCQQSTLLIVAEDLHWADPASVALLAEVAADIPSRPCLLLSTSRPGVLPAWTADVLTVDVLPPAGARALVEAAFGGKLESSLASTVLMRSGGNPFFIEEIARALREADVLVEVGGQVAARPGALPRVPATVQEVLTARLDRLATAPRRVLQAAAVCGRAFQSRVVHRVVRQTDVDRSLNELERETFIHASTPPGRADSSYVFHHALVQEVVYNSQLHSQRRATHAAIGEALEILYANRLDEIVGDLAFHYGRSDSDDKARYWLVRAGDRARALYANSEALAQYRAALERATDGPGPLEAAAILERIGELQTLMGRYDEAVLNLRTGLTRVQVSQHPLVARLRRRLATALLLRGEYEATSATLAEALAALPEPEDAEAAHIGLQVGQLRYRRGEFAAAREALHGAVDLGLRLGIDQLVAQGLKEMGNVAIERGELNEALELYSRSREMYERLEDLVGLADIHNNLGIIYRRTGGWADSLAEYDTSLALCQRVGHLLGIGRCYNNIAEVHRTRGDPSQAIGVYQQAVETWGEIGHALFVGLALVGLGAARVETGDIAGGRADLLDAEARFAAIGSTIYLPDLYRYLAEAELAAGNLEAADRAATRSLEYARAGAAHHHEGATLRVMGQVALARGDTPTARKLLQVSRETLIGVGDALELARTESVLDQLED